MAQVRRHMSEVSMDGAVRVARRPGGPIAARHQSDTVQAQVQRADSKKSNFRHHAALYSKLRISSKERRVDSGGGQFLYLHNFSAL